MAPRKLVLLLVALVIAGGTVIISRGMLTNSSVTAPVETKAPPTQEILVAAHDLPAGSLVKEGDLKWQTWPKEEDTSDSGFAIKGEKEIKDYIGTVVRNGMRVGEPVMPGRIVKAGEQGFMAAALAPGMRAVSIAITPVAGVAGFVFPGDHVDVIVTHQIGQKSENEGFNRRVSETMLKNVRVLALDQKMNDQISEPKVAQIATLEVSPKQAETMALITELGTVSLALRSIANDPSAEEISPPSEPTQATAETTPPSIVLDAAALATGAAHRPPSLDQITWDSDVSKVLPRPANRSGAVQKIQIIRGKETTESIFELQQP
ncbi:MAG: Flp pilus assembly protein CpaB [Alphaproteobacteria bacterium]|nr:Flp pilus assembly protein CpaB [Alphaproteobacteria bacterium]